MQKATKTKKESSDLTGILRNHVWCISGLLGLLIVIALTLWLSKDCNALSHFSLASTLLSIALAVIVVLYTFYQNNNMGNLLSSIPEEMEKSAHIIRQQIDTLKDILSDRNLANLGSSTGKEEPAERDKHAMPAEESLSLGLKLSMCSHLTKVAFYCFVEADNLGNRINTKEILEKLDYRLDPPNEIAKRTWLTSIFNLIAACVGPECTEIGGGGWNITGLDSAFKDNVRRNIKQEIEAGNTELKKAVEKIDEYLGTLRKC